MRIIDADAVQKYAEAEFFYDESKVVEYALSIAPTLDYKDLVPQGEWINCKDGNATCSRCGIRQKAVYDDDNEQHFCGHCGADMRGE